MGPNNGMGYMGGNMGMQNTGMQQMQRPTPQPSFQSFASGQQQQQEHYLPCKFIDDSTRIMPGEVPQNGDPAFFVARDYSCIYAKAWNSSGTIDNVVYVPTRQRKPEDEQREKDQEFQNNVLRRLSGLEDTLATIMSSFSSPKINKQQPKNKESE